MNTIMRNSYLAVTRMLADFRPNTRISVLFLFLYYKHNTDGIQWNRSCTNGYIVDELENLIWINYCLKYAYNDSYAVCCAKHFHIQVKCGAGWSENEFKIWKSFKNLKYSFYFFQFYTKIIIFKCLNQDQFYNYHKNLQNLKPTKFFFFISDTSFQDIELYQFPSSSIITQERRSLFQNSA